MGLKLRTTSFVAYEHWQREAYTRITQIVSPPPESLYFII